MENEQITEIEKLVEAKFDALSKKIADLDDEYDEMLGDLADIRRDWAEHTPSQGWPVEYIAKVPTVAKFEAKLAKKQAQLDAACDALKAYADANKEIVLKFNPLYRDL